MESYSTSQKSVTAKSRSQPSRRTWTIEEEQQLILGLKEAVSRGWKSENGFKTGYLGVLEQHMAQYFPNADIKADPHIASKIHVWKKNYGTLATMLSRSGFGWNDTAHIIEVADDQVWAEYVKSDPNARKMRLKSWPYYNDWSMIFGKDRATGERGSHFGDAVNKLFNGGTTPNPNQSDNVRTPTQIPSDDESDFMSACRGESATSPSKMKHKKSIKRRRVESEVEEKMVDMMNNFIEKTDARWDKIVEKLGFDDGSTMRKKVFDALDNYPQLTMADKMKVTSVICDKKDFEIFFNTSHENRDMLIRAILSGAY